MLFIKYPNLLKRLAAVLLGIRVDSITQFEIRNPEMPPESLGDKFCRLDINMAVDGQRVDLEISRHTALTDKLCLHYFELQKLPETVKADNGLELWLSLFNAETEEELNKLEG